jgi:hypothetical protein
MKRESDWNSEPLTRSPAHPLSVIVVIGLSTYSDLRHVRF